MEPGNTASLEGTLWGSGAWANGTGWSGSGTILTGTVIICGDPAFVAYEAGDYHIGPNSDAIDAGTEAGVRRDIDQEPRPYQTPHMGADEYWPPGSPKTIFLPLVTR